MTPVKPGEYFTYLGVEMICTGNTREIVNGFIFECVKANYFTLNRELKTVVFSPHQYAGIIPHPISGTKASAEESVTVEDAVRVVLRLGFKEVHTNFSEDFKIREDLQIVEGKWYAPRIADKTLQSVMEAYGHGQVKAWIVR